MTSPTITQKTRELVAEYVVLDGFDRKRTRAGHDYGAGQRGAELVRRRRELRYRGFDVELDDAELTPNELVEAFVRVAGARVRRLERENYRRETPATRRTVDAWRAVERSLRAQAVAS